jgi:hypothetical protein
VECGTKDKLEEVGEWVNIGKTKVGNHLITTLKDMGNIDRKKGRRLWTTLLICLTNDCILLLLLVLLVTPISIWESTLLWWPVLSWNVWYALQINIWSTDKGVLLWPSDPPATCKLWGREISVWEREMWGLDCLNGSSSLS